MRPSSYRLLAASNSAIFVDELVASREVTPAKTVRKLSRFGRFDVYLEAKEGIRWLELDALRIAFNSSSWWFRLASHWGRPNNASAADIQL
jgi:hypothetical protein